MSDFYRYVYFDEEGVKVAPWMRDYVAPPEHTRRYSVNNQPVVQDQQRYHLHLITRNKSAAGARLLEIGCGRGDFLRLARSAGFVCAGVEPSSTAVSESRRSGLDVHEGSLEVLPAAIRESRWDVVFLSHVFEHLNEPRKAAYSLRDLLTDDGIVVLEVPNQFKSYAGMIRAALTKAGLRSTPSTIYSIHHLSFFSLRQLEKVFRDSGFHVLGYSWSAKDWRSVSGIARAAVELLGETVARQGSNIQLVATPR
jgi:2-polyprenyl-3-methyl-5-hydroxy-6-metoxy-1,4-benzoquinol methylase